MLLKPPVTKEEALAWLIEQAQRAYGIEITPEIEARLALTAEAMARVSEVDLDEDIEPLLL